MDQVLGSSPQCFVESTADTEGGAANRQITVWERTVLQVWACQQMTWLSGWGCCISAVAVPWV